MGQLPDLSFHRYEVVQELGQNAEGSCTTYLAIATDTDEKVAIKQFRFAQQGSSWLSFRGYEREIQLLQELDYPGIPRYIDSFESADGFCLVQRYQLARPITERHSFSPEEIKQIAVSVLEILLYLQSRIPPIVHRNIRPSTILMDDAGQVYLNDFGLARANVQRSSANSFVEGDPGFAPPEQLFNQPLTEATDLYSLGATLICLLTGTPEGQIYTLVDETYRFQFKEHLPRLHPRFVRWLEKMVEPALKDRYANARKALRDLKRLRVSEHAAIAPNRRPYLFKFLLAGATFSAIAVLVAFVGLNGYLQWRQDRQTPPTALPPAEAPGRGSSPTARDISRATELLKQGKALGESNQHATGLTFIDRALQLYPDYAEAWANRCWLLNNLERHEEAFASCDRALVLNPKQSWALSHRGWAMLELGKLEEALIALDKSIEINPNYYWAWFRKGEALHDLKRYDEAVAAYDRALEIKPDHHRSWNNRAASLNGAQRYTDALISADKAIEIDAQRSSGYYVRSRALYGLERYEEALTTVERSIELAPRYKWGLLTKGQILEKLGRNQESVNAYEEALTVEPDWTLAKEGRDRVLAKLGQQN